METIFFRLFEWPPYMAISDRPLIQKQELWLVDSRTFTCSQSDWTCGTVSLLANQRPFGYSCGFSENDSMLSFSGNLRECLTSVRLALKALFNCWRNSSPFWCKASFCKLKIVNFRQMQLVTQPSAWVTFLLCTICTQEKPSV